MDDYYRKSKEYQRRMNSIERKSKAERILLYVLMGLVIIMIIALALLMID